MTAFRLPAWYGRACRAVSRALWREEVTATEAAQRIGVLHVAAMREAMQNTGYRAH